MSLQVFYQRGDFKLKKRYKENH